MKIAPVILLLAACSASHAETKTADTCVATGKTLGTKLLAWKPPADCKPTRGSQKPELLATEADVRKHLECKDPKAKLAVDFKKHQLVVTSRSYSPAQVGMDVYDDGKKVTFVSRQRSPCKNDPRPMPGPASTFLYQVTTGTRAFADSSCNVSSSCP